MSSIEKIADVTEVNQLISLGKEKGYLTYEEVNGVLPANLVAPEQIDDLMHIFGENEIDIVDTAAKNDKPVELETEKEEEPAPEEPAPAAKPDNVTIDGPNVDCPMNGRLANSGSCDGSNCIGCRASSRMANAPQPLSDDAMRSTLPSPSTSDDAR